MDAIDWDARYSETDRIWSGNPNGALVSVASELTPGTVLDVGCGEGADVVWLGQQGWTPTGLEVSAVALDRARRAADEAGVEASWIHSGIAEADGIGTFDLVATCYPAIPRTPEGRAERALCDAVAPGGHLLYVHHELIVDPEHDHPTDPADYISADTVLTAAAGWAVVRREKRERHVSGGAGAHHHSDDILLLRRPE